MQNKSNFVIAAAIALALGSTTAGAAGWKLANPNPTVPVAGGTVTLEVVYESDGATAATQTDIVIDTLLVSLDSVDTVTSSALCSLIGTNILRSQENLPTNAVIPTGTKCTYHLTAVAGADGDTMPLAFSNELFVDSDGTDTSADNASEDGLLTWIAEGPPSLTYDTSPVALPAGPYGSTQTGTIPANFTPSTGDYSVDFSCVAPAGFTVAPTSGSYDNTDTAADDLTVSATLTDVAQSGDVVCTVTPEGGSATTFTIPVSAPAGAETAPVLDPTPADGGTVTVGGGAPGSNGTGTLVVTPDGGAGTDVAEVSCTADAPVSISPASLSFPVGSSPQNFTVTVPLTDAAQSFPGAVTCSGEDGNGPFEWVFDVSAPAGVAAPTFIPATSLWSKFALIGVFAALGLLMVGLRRNH